MQRSFAIGGTFLFVGTLNSIATDERLERSCSYSFKAQESLFRGADLLFWGLSLGYALLTKGLIGPRYEALRGNVYSYILLGSRVNDVPL